MKTSALNESNKELRPLRMTRRSEKIVAGVAGLAMLGVLGGIFRDIYDGVESLSRQGHDYTTQQLTNMKQVSVVVRSGEGADAVVLESDPGLGPQAHADVRDYVSGQGTLVGKDGIHQLRDSQVVHVPIVKR